MEKETPHFVEESVKLIAQLKLPELPNDVFQNAGSAVKTFLTTCSGTKECDSTCIELLTAFIVSDIRYIWNFY